MRLSTSNQHSFIKNLLTEREPNDRLAERIRLARELATGVNHLPFATASGIIDDLLASPRRGSVATMEREEFEAGVYSYCGDQYVRVYLGQQSGKMLAKRIHAEQDGGEWTVSYEYLGLASRVLTPDTTPERLSLEEVGSLGITFNHCLLCGRRLDDPESVDRGIGPVCAGKY